MIKILIIEDNDAKSKQLQKALMECDIPDKDIVVAHNVKEGKRYLISTSFDVLLLDLVLPIDDEAEPTEDAGVKFLEEIYYRNSIQIPAHIIGVTQFDELYNRHNEDFDDKLWHLINFDLSNQEWREKLLSKINYIIQNKKQYFENLDRIDQYDVGVVCALNVPEFNEIMNLPCSWKKRILTMIHSIIGRR